MDTFNKRQATDGPDMCSSGYRHVWGQWIDVRRAQRNDVNNMLLEVQYNTSMCD